MKVLQEKLIVLAKDHWKRTRGEELSDDQIEEILTILGTGTPRDALSFGGFGQRFFRDAKRFYGPLDCESWSWPTEEKKND